MIYAVPLYEALTEINISKEKAQAVVEALERTMTSELATKSDLEQLRLAMKADLKSETAALRSEMKAEISGLRSEMKAEISGLRSETKAGFQVIEKEMQAQLAAISFKLTVGFGSAAITVIGLLIAVLPKLTG
jgi:hypothetical protein